MGRHTGVTLEARAILADFDPSGAATDRVPLLPGAQHDAGHPGAAPGIAQHDVRVICKDVGGSFGIKVHIYPDEMATCALSVMLGRPVKFTADRLESFGQRHPRERASREGRPGVSVTGPSSACGWTILTHRPYSVYPRTSAVEGNQTVASPPGLPLPRYAATLRVVFQNKTPMCQYLRRRPSHRLRGDGGHGDRARERARPPSVEVRRRTTSRPICTRTPRRRDYFSSASPTRKRSTRCCGSRATRRCAPSAMSSASGGATVGLALRLHRADDAGPRLLRRGRRPHLLEDGLHHQARALRQAHLYDGRDRAGAGDDTMIAQVVASAVGVTWTRARAHRRHHGLTLWRRHLGSRGGIGGEAALQTGSHPGQYPQVAAAMLQVRARGSRHQGSARSSTRSQAK